MFATIFRSARRLADMDGCFSVWLAARAPAERYSDVRGSSGKNKPFLWPHPDALALPPHHLHLNLSLIHI
eukprot:2038247-Alexandrium_andersonii.AAC.1